MNFDVTICQIIALLLFVHLFFLIAIRKKRNDIADLAWGLGFVILSLVALIHNPNINTMFVFVLVSFWGLRLFYYILKKIRSKKEEDARYAKWRKDWGEAWILGSYLKVFLLQGFFLLLVAMPIMLNARYSEGEWGFVNIVGVLLFLMFWVMEIIADRQLYRFIKEEKGKHGGRIMRKGLWSYSRHPNYFAEAGLWWGIWLVTWGHEYAWYGVIGPITIFILLRYVSGVPMAEERYQDDPEYIEYKKKTPAFFPKFL